MNLSNAQVETLAGKRLSTLVKANVTHWSVENYGGLCVLQPCDGEEGIAPYPGLEVSMKECGLNEAESSGTQQHL